MYIKYHLTQYNNISIVYLKILKYGALGIFYKFVWLTKMEITRITDPGKDKKSDFMSVIGSFVSQVLTRQLSYSSKKYMDSKQIWFIIITIINQ